MHYDNKLGIFGNMKKLYEEANKTNAEAYNMKNRVASNEEVNNITFVALAETHVLSDDVAARHAEVFEEWAVGVSFKAGQMRRDPLNGRLYRCLQAHTSVEGWNPSLTPALWSVVDVDHAGTQDDPIIAGRGMEYEEGKYYLDEEDGNVYLCTRGGVLQYLPHELIGQYFEQATNI